MGGLRTCGCLPEILNGIGARNDVGKKCFSMVVVQSSKKFVRQNHGSRTSECPCHSMEAIHGECVCLWKR